jgi:hypothetical protein
MQERERFRPLSVGVHHDLGATRQLLQGRSEKIRVAERVPPGHAHRVVTVAGGPSSRASASAVYTAPFRLRQQRMKTWRRPATRLGAGYQIIPREPPPEPVLPHRLTFPLFAS